MKNIFFIIILSALSFSASAGTTTLSSFTLFDESPAGHTKIVASAAWFDPIAYNTGPTVDCNGPLTEANSWCTFTLDRTMLGLPVTAKVVKLLVKAKAWAITGPGASNFCQVFLKVESPTYIKNFFIHAETYGINTEQRRDTDYTSIDASFISGEVSILVGREIVGDCRIETAIYLEGYYE